jgi:hypothetical protein
MDFPDNLLFWWNFLGMLEVSDKPLLAKKGFFVLVDSKGSPLKLCLGRGLIGKTGKNGHPILLPDHVNPEYVAKFIRFIPPANYKAAVKLSREIHYSPSNDPKVKQRHLRRALALCRN